MMYTHAVAALVAAALAATGAWQVQAWRWSGQVAKIKQAHAEQLQTAEAAARAKEQTLQRQAERIAHEAAKKQVVLSARVATADLAAGQLRDEIARLNARPAPAGADLAAITGEARTARELLGACAAEYRGVAKAADELRDQVGGLQEFAANVCK
jgi:chromosome segregation ATPase